MRLDPAGGIETWTVPNGIPRCRILLALVELPKA